MAKLLLLCALVLAVAVVAVPFEAAADPGTKAANTLSNAALGWTNCPKAWVDEVGKGAKNPLRGVLGALVTGPVMCGVNVGATYLGVAADVVSIPWGDNALPPAAHASVKPPLTLKE